LRIKKCLRKDLHNGRSTTKRGLEFNSSLIR
jgi:hypothetical protein